MQVCSPGILCIRFAKTYLIGTIILIDREEVLNKEHLHLMVTNGFSLLYHSILSYRVVPTNNVMLAALFLPIKRDILRTPTIGMDMSVATLT
jgi:hypothetical protein